MMAFAAALTTAVLPIVAIAGAGYLLGTRWDIDVDSLNTVTLQLLLPALAFHTLAVTTLGGAVAAQILVGVVVFVAVMVLIAGGTGRATGTSEPFLSALVLASVFPNSGNFGIPLSDFAFGPTGRTTAIVYVTVQNVLVYTLGAYIASRGQGRTGFAAVAEVAKLPLVYAALAALALRWVGLVPPAESSVMVTLKLVGDASIPLMLVILGTQLARIDTIALRTVVTPSVLKLGVAPAVGLGIAMVIGFEDPTVAQVFVLLCATPSAILPLVLTLAYSEPTPAADLTAAEYVSTAIFVTTVVSVAVLTGLIVALQSGLLL